MTGFFQIALVCLVALTAIELTQCHKLEKENEMLAMKRIRRENEKERNGNEKGNSDKPGCKGKGHGKGKGKGRGNGKDGDDENCEESTSTTPPTLPTQNPTTSQLQTQTPTVQQTTLQAATSGAQTTQAAQTTFNAAQSTVASTKLSTTASFISQTTQQASQSTRVVSKRTTSLPISKPNQTTRNGVDVNYAGAKQVSSPNFNRGRQGQKITCLVLHGTAGDGTVEWFENPQSKVSAHYVVGKDGSVTQMVSEDDTAWHNGVVTKNSQFYGRPNPNYWCIGIEFSRNAQNNNIMPEVQIKAGVKLVTDIKRRYPGINIYTHDQFNVGRVCPGPKFPLDRFKSA